MSLAGRITGRLLHEAHWRCAEPVVVIESDDWGLDRTPCWDLVGKFGEPTDWALETTETAEDLECLAEVLDSHRDLHGRPVCFTGNFVMANPDYEETRKSAYEHYHELPLSLTVKDPLKHAYAASIRNRCFFPQYHGLRHHNAPALLRDIRENAEARALFDGRCATGMSFAKGHLWRYHSEYADWSDGGSADEARLTSIVRTGTEHFERMFGFQSSSTIPPHYVVSDAAFRVWKSMGIRYVQGSNYQIHAGVGGAKLIRSRYLGQRETSGMLLMGRNVKFEPRPGRKESVQKAVAQAGQMFAARIPVVVDTHRINYTGQFRAEGLAALRQLVMALDSYKPLYLTTAELAEAIDAGGPFRDSFTKSERALTPLATVRQYAARKLA